MKLIQILGLFAGLLLMTGCPSGGDENSSSSNPVCGANAQSCPGRGGTDHRTQFSVTGSVPENLEKNIPVEGPYGVFLGEEIADYSVLHNSALPGQENTVILRNTLSGEEMLIDVQVQGNELLIHPTLPLEGSTEYSLEMTPGLESINGESLETAHKIYFETQTTQGSSIAGETVVSWSAEHEKNRPIDHFILYYGTEDAQTVNTSGEKKVSPEHNWANKRVIRPKSLDPELEGQRAYHVEFNNHDLPGLIPGTYNYFSMKACNGDACSDFSNQAEKYLD